jgi:2'-hydroxyisoflavone reductase
MLWPGSPSDPIQIIDARDLANFSIDCLEQRITGTYNTVTPAGVFTMGDLLEDSVAVTAADMTPVWVSASFLREHDATQSIPIWPSPDGEDSKAALVSGERAFARGMKTRPTRETARDTVAWWKALPEERTETLRAGLGPDQEARLLSLL